jgi:hypothetical protein
MVQSLLLYPTAVAAIKPYTLLMASNLLELEKSSLSTKADDPKYAHYAESSSVTEGYIMGVPVMAICGEMFIPSRDPLKFPICPICKSIAEALFLGEE